MGFWVCAVVVLTAADAGAADAGAPHAALPPAVGPVAPSATPLAAPKKMPPPLPKPAVSTAKPKSVATQRPAGKAVRGADVGTRRQVAGGPTAEDVALGPDSPELRVLHAAERELFPPAMPALNVPWPSDLPSPLAATDDMPRVHASGLPPSPVPSAPPLAEGGKDLSWLSKLQLPDLPVRWDARLVRYLEFFKDDPRGHAMLTTWFRRSGRFKDTIRRTLP